jgi:hypothetical protein
MPSAQDRLNLHYFFGLGYELLNFVIPILFSSMAVGACPEIVVVGSWQGHSEVETGSVAAHVEDGAKA